MAEEAIEILHQVKEKITDNSDLSQTGYNSAKELREVIDKSIIKLSNGDKDILKETYIHFAPTSTFQEHSIANGWEKKYLKLAAKFDKVYERMKTCFCKN